MRNTFLVTMMVFIIVGAFLPATAKEDLEQTIQVSGKVYAYYHYDLTEYPTDTEKSANEFDLGRAYVRFKGKITDNIKAEVTFDAGREYTYSLTQNLDNSYTLNKTKERFGVYVKYAYLDVGDLIPSHHLQGGMIATPWICYEDKIWGWRAVRKSVLDENKYTNSADLGIGIKGKFVDGLIDHHFTFTNGEGYKNPETFMGKDVEYRLSFFPLHNNENLKGLSANVYAHYGNIMGKETVDDTKEISYGGLFGFDHDIVTIGAGYFMQTTGPETAEVDGNVITGYGTGHFLGDVLHPFARVDLVDPNKDAANDKYTNIIGGIGYTFAGGWCSVIPNFHMTMPEDDSAQETRDFFLTTEIVY
ncbi:MAG: hypothetical protein GY771_00175 [bacterium]|nr:hypothetical protein [bacterium]